MKKIICLLLLAMTTIFFTGCQNETIPAESETDEQVGQSITFTDDLGREVTVNHPQRVAALLGSYADIWYLAGGTICASADDAWEDFDLPLTEEVINLGMTKDLSLEKLLEADPDFVLASSNTKGNVEWMDTLEAAGIPTAYFGVSDFDDYLRVLNYCTDITGRKDLYQKNGLDLQAKIEEVVEKSKERIEAAGSAPTVLSLRASSTYIRAKNSQDNVLGEMLKALGCINIADQDDSLLENLSIEHILKQDPDYIFIVQQGDDEEGTRMNMNHFIADNPAWSELTAVKENRVYFMEKPLYALKPNNRWAEAYEKLEGILANEQKQD
ncbi:MAG: ABC transporter substrate-binding protein [Lachnospiraceae bacterium]